MSMNHRRVISHGVICGLNQDPQFYLLLVGPSQSFPIYDTVKGDNNPTTLHELAEKGLASDIYKLVERRLDVDLNEKDRYGRTPLHWAAEAGHIDAAEVLIDLGSDVEARDNMGRTPVHLAARSAHQEMLRSVLEHLDANQVEELVNAQDHRGTTAVFLASQKGKEGEAAFKYLMQCGAKYNKQNPLVRPGHKVE